MNIAWTRWYAIIGVAAALCCAIFVLDYTRYPFEPYRLFIFDYLFRRQDVSGAAVAAVLALAAALPLLARPGLALVALLGRHPWRTATVLFVVLCAAQFVVEKNHALAGDEYLILMQARAFGAGRLTAQFPPALLTWVVPWPYVNLWLYASLATGKVVSVYWPGFALVLAPFTLAGLAWACNPLLASASLVFIGRLAARLTGAPQAAGWAMLLALASPTFTGMALGYFSMTAHLFFNLLYAWLLLERTPRRLFLAGVVGSFAMVLNNPVPHLLFAAPWIAWIAWREGRWSLLRLAAGYAPITLIVGLGWWFVMRDVQGYLWFSPYEADSDLGHRFGNFLFHWQLQFDRVFVEPDASTIAKRIGELVKLWLWTVPGLPALMLAGWWLARRDIYLRLLGLSFACTVAGYLFVKFDQGYGWGVRYLHPAFAALPVLGAAALVALQGTAAEALRRYFAAAALVSLAVATPFRSIQIERFMGETLARRPPYERGVPQAVFVKPDFPHYAQDFVQNDPFLRDPVIFLFGRGRDTNEMLLEEYFPPARLVSDGPHGQVWRLEEPFATRRAQRPAQ